MRRASVDEVARGLAWVVAIGLMAVALACFVVWRLRVWSGVDSPRQHDPTSRTLTSHVERLEDCWCADLGLEAPVPSPPSISGAGRTVGDEEGARPSAAIPSPPRPAVAPPVPPPPSGGDDLAVLLARRLEVPVAGVTRAELRDSYDEPRGGGDRKHVAIDIMAPRGRPVVAVETGTIARLFESRLGGTTIYQFGRRGRFSYYYAHLERYAEGLLEGAAVDRGQVIGFVGSSGNAPDSAPHLHFAIYRLTPERRWWEGDPINPYAVLAEVD